MVVEISISMYKDHAVPTSTEQDLRNLNKTVSLSCVSALLCKIWPYNQGCMLYFSLRIYHWCLNYLE